MRHLKAGKKLGRNASHRLALYRNLALALLRVERIITTLPKAKAVRPFVEKLITLAKKAAAIGQMTDLSDLEKKARMLHARRMALARLGPTAKAIVKPGAEEAEGSTTILEKLFDEIGPRYLDRAGGYTRIIKRHQRRLGDAGETAFLELLKEGEKKVKAKAAAPAPRIEEEEETTPETEGQEQTQEPAEETPPEQSGEAEQEKK